MAVEKRGHALKLSMPVFSGILTEFAAASACLIVCSLLWVLGALSVDAAVWLISGYLTALLFLAWWRFDGGNHPVFLFLGLLLVGALAISASFLMGIYGPVGRGGAVILVLVAALAVPYLVVAPALQLANVLVKLRAGDLTA